MVVPSTDTQRIQEYHIMIGHIVCELIDETLEMGPMCDKSRVSARASIEDAKP